MRAPIIDTTRTVSVVTTAEFFGDDEIGPGFVIVERCPVNGISAHPRDFETREEALAAIAAIYN